MLSAATGPTQGGENMIGAVLLGCKQGRWVVVSALIRIHALLFRGWPAAMGLGLSFGLVASAQAQQITFSLFDAADTPPQQAMARIIANPGALCPELVGRFNANQIAPGSQQEDILVRCRELVSDADAGVNLDSVSDGLQAMAYEEAATQGTNAVETSNNQLTNIRARLAALRGGAIGINLRRFALYNQEQTFPGTLIASLSPDAAVASTAPAETPSLVKKLGIFANGTLSIGDKDATSREAGFDFDSLGVTAGIDYRFTQNFILGLAFGYMSTDVDLDMSGGGLDTTGYSVSLYGTYYIGNFYLDGVGGVGWNDYDLDRTIHYAIRERNPDGSLTGEMVRVNQTAKGNTDGTWYTFGFSGGYDFQFGSLTVGPFGQINYTKVDIDGYQEEIDGTDPGFGLALDIDSQDVESLTSALGAQISYALSTRIGVLLPQMRFAWEHEFENDSRTIRAHFVNDPTPDAQTQIQLVTDDPDRDFFNLGAGLSATFRGGVSAFVFYETVLGLDDVTVHNVALGVRLEL